MPKLNKIRLTRIRYNNNLTGIDDTIIDLAGISTLLKLANGGGKTVLIQMLLSPYVSARRRNFKGRPFSDYFKDPLPSFIVEEWVKDNRSGKFLIGLMVRKSQHGINEKEEIDDRKLDLYGFVAEYSEPCEYDIDQLQLVRQKPKSFLPFSVAKDYLENLSRIYPSSFRLYNLNNYATERKYREKLIELNIDRSEWDQLWEFNQDESGLSSLCEKYNTDQKLARDVFVPAVEQKLDQLASDDRDFSQIKIFQDDLRGIAEMQLRNIENLENQKELESLLEQLNSLRPLSDQLIGHQENVTGQKMRFCELIEGYREEGQKIDEEMTEQKKLLQEGEKELSVLKYEMLSQKYYHEESLYAQAQEELDRHQETNDILNAEINRKERLIREQELMMMKKELTDYEQEKAQYQGKIDMAKMSEHALMNEAARLGSGLYQIYLQQLQDAQDKKTIFEQEIEKNEKARTSYNKENTNRQKKLDGMLKEIGGYEAILKNYEEEEKQTAAQLDLSINHTMVMYEDKALMRGIADQKGEELEKVSELLSDRYLKREGKLKELEQCKARLAKDNEEKIRLENQQEKFQRQVKADEKILEDRRFFIRTLGMNATDSNSVWELKKISQQFDYRIHLTHENIDLASGMLVQLKKELENLKTGCSLTLSEPIRDVLKELGILEMYGSEWLKSSAGNQVYRERILKNHPFLPYSLVMTDSEIEKFLARLNDEKLFTSEPIPIVSRNKLSKNPEPLDLSKDGLYFYLSFNEALIDQDVLEKMINEQEGKIKSEQSYQQNQYDMLENLQKHKTRFLQEQLDKKEYGRHLREMQNADEKMRKLLDRINRSKQQEQLLDHEIKNLQEEIDRTEILEKRAKDQVSLARQLYESFLRASKANEKMWSLNTQIDQVQKEIETVRTNLEKIADHLADLRKEVQEISYMAKSLEKEATRYEIYKDSEPAAEEEPILKGRFEALQKKLQDSQIDFFEEQLVKTLAKIRELEQRYSDSKKGFTEEYGSNEFEFDQKDYLFQDMEKLRRQVRKARKEKENVTGRIQKLERSIGEILGIMKNLGSQMEQIANTNSPLPKEQTRTVDLEPEKKRVRELIADTRAQLEKAQERLVVCDRLYSQGKDKFQKMPQINLAEVPDLHLLSIDELKEKYRLSSQDLSLLEDHVGQCRKRIENHINVTISMISINRSDLIAMLNAMKETIEDGELLKKDLDVKISICQSMVDKLAGELERLKKNTALFNENLLDYVHKMNEQIKRIDHSTTITLNGHRRQMLQIEMPDWQTMENVYRIQVDRMTASVLDEIIKDPNEMERLIRQKISSKEMINEVIGFQKIRLRLYKVEQGRESRISWSQANKTSGAEGFICAFVVVSALLAYRRTNENRLFTEKKQGNVLLMDNPFAKVQSKHIVDALMNLCEVTNTQLIAFSDVENSAIINAFDNIYTLRKKRRMDGKDVLEVEHVKEVEETLENIHLHIEQETLF